MSTRTTPKRLRIAVVAPCPFPSARGSQVLIRELAEMLARRGHEVHVVAYPVGEHLVPVQDIVVHRYGWPWLARTQRLPWLARKILCDVALMVGLYRLVRASCIDVVHAHNYEGPVIAWWTRMRTGCPVVYHAHNVLADELPAYFSRGAIRWGARWLGAILDRVVPRLADRVVALSSAQQRALASAGVSQRRIRVVPPPLPRVLETRETIRGVESSATSPFVVGYAGNLDPYQDLDVLLRGFELFGHWHPRAGLLLVTHDRQWPRFASPLLRTLARDGTARVVVCRSFSETQTWLANADVLVCPRGSWSGYPIKFLNYCVFGKPVVLASGAALGVGWSDPATVFPAGQPAGLANVLLRLATDSRARGAAAAAARAFVLRMPDRRTLAQQLEEVFGTVLPLRRGRGATTEPQPAHLGVDTHEASSYKRADDAREDEARA